jgi:hypothetical protein
MLGLGYGAQNSRDLLWNIAQSEGDDAPQGVDDDVDDAALRSSAATTSTETGDEDDVDDVDEIDDEDEDDEDDEDDEEADQHQHAAACASVAE